ncbi:MAG: hypothetical protein IPQ13_14105 [Holophagaceae bacterium]|nr:hypothetical protein [Holophagaceae bacterium]
MPRLTVLFVLAALPCAADGLADLRGILSRLQGSGSVRATAEIQNWRQEGEGKKARIKQSRSTVQLEDGPSGLRLGWSPSQIQGARKESQLKATDPEAATPNLDSLSALNGLSAATFLSQGDHLLQQLKGASLLEDRSDTYMGKPARLLAFKLDPAVGAEEKSMIKDRKETLKVWLDGNGIPVGTEHAVAIKASKFLISFTASNREARNLAVLGGRLVVASETQENSGSGMGFSNTSKKVTALSFF